MLCRGVARFRFLLAFDKENSVSKQNRTTYYLQNISIGLHKIGNKRKTKTCEQTINQVGNCSTYAGVESCQPTF